MKSKLKISLPVGDVKIPDRPKLLEVLGHDLITGASGDDPSGIATYSQAGMMCQSTSLILWADSPNGLNGPFGSDH